MQNLYVPGTVGHHLYLQTAGYERLAGPAEGPGFGEPHWAGKLESHGEK